jgi:hypothetical protein
MSLPAAQQRTLDGFADGLRGNRAITSLPPLVLGVLSLKLSGWSSTGVPA